MSCRVRPEEGVWSLNSACELTVATRVEAVLRRWGLTYLLPEMHRVALGDIDRCGPNVVDGPRHAIAAFHFLFEPQDGPSLAVFFFVALAEGSRSICLCQVFAGRWPPGDAAMRPDPIDDPTALLGNMPATGHRYRGQAVGALQARALAYAISRGAAAAHLSMGGSQAAHAFGDRGSAPLIYLVGASISMQTLAAVDMLHALLGFWADVASGAFPPRLTPLYGWAPTHRDLVAPAIAAHSADQERGAGFCGGGALGAAMQILAAQAPHARWLLRVLEVCDGGDVGGGQSSEMGWTRVIVSASPLDGVLRAWLHPTARPGEVVQTRLGVRASSWSLLLGWGGRDGDPFDGRHVACPWPPTNPIELAPQGAVGVWRPTPEDTDAR
jgi:hypothetical protein